MGENRLSILTTPYGGSGITLSYREAATGAFSTPLAFVKDDAGFSGWENTTIEIKTLISASITKIPGRSDYGTFKGAMYLVNADGGNNELLNLFANKKVVWWQVQLPDGTPSTATPPVNTGSTFVFQAFVGGLTPGNFSGDDAPELEFELPISGPVTFALGS